MGKLIFATLGFVIAGVLLFVYIQPTYAQIGLVKAQIATYDTALQKAAQLEQLKQSLLQRYNSFNPNDISRLQAMLPDHADNIGLILELDSLASRYGLSLANVDVSSNDDSNGGTSGTSNAAPSSPTSPQDIQAVGGTSTYSTITLHFTTYGTYDNFRSFLSDLEKSLRVVDLVSLNIAQGGKSGDSSNTQAQASSQKGAGTYTYETTITTYWLK